MAHGKRAQRLQGCSQDRCDYSGRRPGNAGWGQAKSRRGHAPQGGPSAKTITHRKERRQGKRAAKEADRG